jgi:hypothetical protein
VEVVAAHPEEIVAAVAVAVVGIQLQMLLLTLEQFIH